MWWTSKWTEKPYRDAGAASKNVLWLQDFTHEKTRTKTKYLGKFWVYLKNKKSARKLTVHVFIYYWQNAQSDVWLLFLTNGKIMHIFNITSCFSDFLCLDAIWFSIYQSILKKLSRFGKSFFFSWTWNLPRVTSSSIKKVN